jgi:hypothetical protein
VHHPSVDLCTRAHSHLAVINVFTTHIESQSSACQAMITWIQPCFEFCHKLFVCDSKKIKEGTLLLSHMLKCVCADVKSFLYLVVPTRLNVSSQGLYLCDLFFSDYSINASCITLLYAKMS